MKSVGIVAEYNPFHLGHKYNIVKSREQVPEDSAVISIMSGDFVQRGEAAIFNKYSRAAAAISSGADLVIELPLPWSIATAEIFARGAVGIMNAIGVSDICFGAETDDIQLLKNAADIISSDEFTYELKKIVSENRSTPYAVLREQLLQEKYNLSSEVLSKPNNILGVEYLKAVKLYHSNIVPHSIKRIGNGHDEKGNSIYKSASEIREILRAGKDVSSMLPSTSYIIYEKEAEEGRIQCLDEDRYMSRLTFLNCAELCRTAYCTNGLGEALYNAIRTSSNVEEIIEKTVCKTYTRARIRRALISAVLKNTEEPGVTVPGYARILSMNQKGRAWLKENRIHSEIPLITKSADMRKLPLESRIIAELTADAHDFYTLGYKDKSNYIPGEDWMYTPAVTI